MIETIFLRFENESEALARLFDAGLTLASGSDGTLSVPPDGSLQGSRVALSVVGGDGTVRRSPTENASGYHVNIAITAGPLPEALAAWRVEPHRPQEIFFNPGTEHTEV